MAFNQAFESTIQSAPSKSNSEGLSFQLNGVDGDKAIVGFRMPELTEKAEKVEFIPQESSSEKLALTPKKLDEIQANLSELDPQKWQVLTKLPAPIFRLNVLLASDRTSPNNAKKESYFLVTVPSAGTQKKVMTGGVVTLGQSLEIGEITRTLAATKVDLVYRMGMRPPGKYSSSPLSGFDCISFWEFGCWC